MRKCAVNEYPFRLASVTHSSSDAKAMLRRASASFLNSCHLQPSATCVNSQPFISFPFAKNAWLARRVFLLFPRSPELRKNAVKSAGCPEASTVLFPGISPGVRFSSFLYLIDPAPRIRTAVRECAVRPLQDAAIAERKASRLETLVNDGRPGPWRGRKC